MRDWLDALDHCSNAAECFDTEVAGVDLVFELWRVEDGVLDWFVLRSGSYEPLVAGPDGILRSGVFPGLWLDAAALLAADLPQALAVLHQGLVSPEHAAFVAALGVMATPPE